MSDDRIVERDERGRITKSKLTSEQAKEMAAKKHQKGLAEKEDQVIQLVEDKGYSMDDAPLLIILLSEAVVAGGSREITAAAEYRRFPHARDRDASVKTTDKPKPGTLCPLCGEMVMTGFRPSDEQLDMAEDFLTWHRQKSNDEK